MPEVINAIILDHAWCGLDAEPGVAKEIQEKFSFFATGYKFMPKYRSGMWDGKIRLYNMITSQFPVGLLPRLYAFCKYRGYKLNVTTNNIPYAFGSTRSVTLANINDFATKINSKYQPFEYQGDAIIHALNTRRTVLKSPTGSGKSLMIYLLMRWHQLVDNGVVLVIVPDTGLINQMQADFRDYGFNDLDDHMHIIYQGQDKSTNKRLVLTTWQSVYKLPKKWFARYSMIIGDEAHGFAANSLSAIMNKSANAHYRIGLTGTLDGTKVHQLSLEGLFGPVKVVTTTKKLQDENVLAPLKIEVVRLKHPPQPSMDYQREVRYLYGSDLRTQFIVGLADKLKGNTIILYRWVDQHGKPLYNAMKAQANDAYPVHYFSGEVDGKEREVLRKLINKYQRSVTVASMGTTSTGINIPNIHNIIFASPYKRQIKILQSIGRGLRKSDNGWTTTLFDIADIIPYYNADSGQELTRRNTTHQQSIDRLKIYDNEQFEYKINTIKLEP